MMQIEAQESLLTINMNTFPSSDKLTVDQKKLHKQLHKIGYPKDEGPMTLDKLEKLLRDHGK